MSHYLGGTISCTIFFILFFFFFFRGQGSTIYVYMYQGIMYIVSRLSIEAPSPQRIVAAAYTHVLSSSPIEYTYSNNNNICDIYNMKPINHNHNHI